MKKLLREALENELEAISERIAMLDRHIKGYAEAGLYGDAAINKIKRETLQMVYDNFMTIIKSH